MSTMFDSLPSSERALLRPSAQPRRFDPMKATLTRDAFSREGWIFERKLDGIRCVAARDGEEVRLLSRTGHLLNRSYPELVEALERERCEEFVIDGEIVAFEGKITSFSRLQGRMQISDPERARRSGIEIFYYVFDLLHLAGQDTRALTVRSRKSLLRKALSPGGPVRLHTHRNTEGEALYREACKRGLEGVIGKRADSRYQEGRRSGDWLKFKCVAEQELVIGGYTAPKGSRTDFGALLVGYYDDGAFRYAGKVGTGFDRNTLSTLGQKLRRLETPDTPFERGLDRKPAATHWVKPELVAQIGFAEWTRDGHLRQPRYMGLRDDKPAAEVVRERPR